MYIRDRTELKYFFGMVCTISLPIACQNLLTTTASMVDTIMIGSQGEFSVAAVGICSQISTLFSACCSGFAGGALPLFSQYWGTKDKDGINRTFGISLVCMLGIALLFGGVAVATPDFLLRIYTDKQKIIKVAVPYIRIVGFAYPLQALGTIISFLMRSTERVKIPFLSSIAAMLTNCVLNWILIYGRFGAPGMGVAGAAVGTLVSGIVNLIFLLCFLVRDKKFLPVNSAVFFQWKGGFFNTYLKKSLPVICNDLLYGVGQMLINIVIGRQAESAIAAMAAFRVLEGFVFAFFGGLADACTVVVGKQIGSGQHMRGYRYAKRFTVLCPAVIFCIILICLTFSQFLFELFGLGPEALRYGKYMLSVYLVAGTIRTCNYIMNACYRAGGDAVFGTVLEIICLFTISVPAIWLAGIVFHLSFPAIFAFIYTDEIIRLILEIWYTKTGKWVKPVTEEGKIMVEQFRQELEKCDSCKIKCQKSKYNPK